MTEARVVGLGTALPPHRFTQEEAIEELRRWYAFAPSRPDLPLERAEAVFRNAGVETRHGVFPPGALLVERSLGEKNRIYLEAAAALAERAAVEALRRAEIAPAAVDLLVTTSCTGFAIPALDVRLLERLPFRRDIRRLPVTELGCGAGVAALRIAHDFLRAYPGATVLVVAAETPTLTFQPSDYSADHVVSCAIFGDGAAAAVLSDEAGPGLSIRATATRFFPGTADFMGFDLETTGFHIFLSRRIPSFVRTDLVPALADLLDGAGTAPEEVGTWLIHPGGPRILDAIEESLDLPAGGLAASRAVLRRVGNLSSATILFVIDEYLRGAPPAHDETACIAAVGPGFQLDAAVAARKGGPAWTERASLSRRPTTTA